MFYSGPLLFGFLFLGVGTVIAVFLPKATTTQIAPGDLGIDYDIDYDGYDDGGDSGDSGDGGDGGNGGGGGGGD